MRAQLILQSVHLSPRPVQRDEVVGESQGATVGGSVVAGTSSGVLAGEDRAGLLLLRPLQLGNCEAHVVNMEISTR